MAIDVRSISITGAFNAIKSFFQSQENNSKWKDFQTGAEGNFLMRLLANVVRNISQNVITGRREIFQDTANLLSSNIGMAVNNSYSVYRGRNQRRIINFTPADNMTIPKFTCIATGNDYNVYTLSDLTFVAGEAMEFPVVIGNLQEVQWTANTTALKRFVRFEQGISEDVDLLVDGTSMSKEGALSRELKDLIYDCYYIYTNPWKSVSIKYLNNASNATHKYSTDTVFTLRYIQLEDIKAGDFDTDMFSQYGTLNSVLTIENFIPFEEVSEIKINSPVHRETQTLVRSKADFADLVREFVPSINQTGYSALTPTYTAVTYMKNDYSRLEDFEKENLEDKLDPCMAFGRPLPDLVDPVEEVTTLDITVGVTNRYTDEASITADVQSLVDAQFANKLNGSFDKYELENLINKLSYVRYSRVDVHVADREAYVTQKVGDHITANERTYKCTGILGQAGINEPDWNIPADDTTVENIYTGLETVDKNLVWVCYKRLDIENIQPWKPSKKFKLGDYIYSDSIPQYMFKCVDVLKTTGVDAPDITGVEVGDYVNDGNMVLLCITYNSSYPDRLANTQYRLGSKFNYAGLSFEYVGATGVTSTDDVLTFNDANYQLFAMSDADYRKAYAIDGQNCLYIEDTDVANMVNPGDILRVNIVENVDKEWEEVPADQLTMNSKITAKVKDYEDVEEEDDDEDEPTPADVTISTENIYTGNVIPNIAGVELGASIDDGGFTITRVPFDSTYPERISAYSYNNNDKFTITVWKEEVDEETGEVTEVVDYAYSFTVVVPVIENLTGTPVQEDDPTPEPEVQNANWKELEKYLALQDEVQAWIASEGPDKLRVPSDVIQFFYEIGRITAEEREMLTRYYAQYDDYDEEQIYMYMDSMGATRLDAIAMMSREDAGHEHCHQLKDPISDADCVRQYDADKKLVYVDRYTSTTGGFTVYRTDAEGVLRAQRTYIYDEDGNVVLSEEIINKDSEAVSRVYLVTAVYADAPARDVNGRVRNLTRIVPATAIARYSQGYVDISFTKTDDGEIRWEQVTNTDTINYDWNVYSNYNINLTVKY